MTEIRNSKKYDLEGRCLIFAKKVRDYIKKLPRNTSNIEYSKQLIRSSGSVGANYIEANESLSRKDFFMRIKISRKEAKESEYWLSLAESNNDIVSEKDGLIQEATELRKIFGSILEKSKTDHD
ncbi:MAG: four helix bundle protein [Candidatus Zambryskibacteria bacterium RIFCSPLOWO2_02_FULL_44_12b]|uniref:Four helix bundle protein n=1 Tax=Candidatus Zambryskibacteria bacterium RIFCSPLOWO2_02_FULL_44_12b TaxID=1802772 RepID=A0A1G2UK91_9BACT|nr:MAG: four helix bundle protein [Candidatus Zambryskibacteria bacterium RIFCSPLOWO2_02_FULL_44_12b]